jgi:hypothetical protein
MSNRPHFPIDIAIATLAQQRLQCLQQTPRFIADADAQTARSQRLNWREPLTLSWKNP